MPNIVVAQKQLWLQQVVAEQHTQTKFVCWVFYNRFEHGSTNQNQGPELFLLELAF